MFQRHKHALPYPKTKEKTKIYLRYINYNKNMTVLFCCYTAVNLMLQLKDYILAKPFATP